jgi:hypothetical protein
MICPDARLRKNTGDSIGYARIVQGLNLILDVWPILPSASKVNRKTRGFDRAVLGGRAVDEAGLGAETTIYSGLPSLATVSVVVVPPGPKIVVIIGPSDDTVAAPVETASLPGRGASVAGGLTGASDAV